MDSTTELFLARIKAAAELRPGGRIRVRIYI